VARRSRLALACVGAILLLSFAAEAQNAAAQQLFDEGKALLAAGRLADACPKLAESQRLDPSPGTLFHLSDCHERQGRLASAWAGFLEVAGAARAAGKTVHEGAARQRAKALEPRLARLRIDVDPAGAKDVVVERDGIVVTAAAIGVEVPVDVGLHVVTAHRGSAVLWRAEIDVRDEGRTTLVRVPAVQDAPPATARTTEKAASPSHGNFRRALAIALGSGSLAGAGVGTYFGLHAIALDDQSAAHCLGNRCDAAGVDLRDRALTNATTSTVLFVVAGALLVGAAALWWTAGARRTATLPTSIEGFR
jgi:hypothetical protein